MPTGSCKSYAEEFSLEGINTSAGGTLHGGPGVVTLIIPPGDGREMKAGNDMHGHWMRSLRGRGGTGVRVSGCGCGT